jgi:hypothetical protein
MSGRKFMVTTTGLDNKLTPQDVKNSLKIMGIEAEVVEEKVE